MLPIVDRYLLGEALKTFFAIVFALALIMASMLFLRTLEEVSLGALNADLVLRFLGLQMLRDSPSLLPPAFFIAALAALSRLARDSELIALNACGVGPRRVYRALLILAVPVALLTGWLSLIAQPWAASGIAAIRVAQKEQAARVAGLQGGRFYVEAEGDLVVYIGAIDPDKGLERVFIMDRRDQKTRVVVSESGRHILEEPSGDHMIRLVNGHRFDGNPGQGAYLIGQFDEYRVRLRATGDAQRGSSKRTTAPTRALLDSPDIADRAEVEHRISAPLAILTLAIVAVPLVNVSPRQRTAGRLLLAFIAYFAFFNLQRLAESWMIGGVTPPWLTSFWYQPLILALVYLTLLPDSIFYKRLRERLMPRRREPQPGAP